MVHLLDTKSVGEKQNKWGNQASQCLLMSTSILINIMTYTIILLTGFSCAYLIFISDTLNNLFPIMSRYVIKHSSFEYLCLKTVKFIDISTHLGPVSLKTVNVTNSATFNTDLASSYLSNSPWDLGAKLCDNELIPQPWVSQLNHKNWQSFQQLLFFFFFFFLLLFFCAKLRGSCKGKPSW